MDYLLSCDCGRKVRVSSGDAGSTAPCACGRSVDVPGLDQLRALPLAPPLPPSRVDTAYDNPLYTRTGQRIIGLFVLLLSTALAIGGWGLATRERGFEASIMVMLMALSVLMAGCGLASLLEPFDMKRWRAANPEGEWPGLADWPRAWWPIVTIGAVGAIVLALCALA